LAEKISQETRSRMMAGIRGRDTKPEILVRSFLHGAGFRFRLCRRDLPGRPDIVLPRWRTVVFAHGCFWHGHAGCRYFRLPKTRPEFWEAKIATNATRDAAAEQALAGLGWRVAVVWECALRDDATSSLDQLENFIRSGDTSIEIGSPE
jgi:DNA mismatch endonuclease (patch repair protein)